MYRRLQLVAQPPHPAVDGLRVQAAEAQPQGVVYVAVRVEVRCRHVGHVGRRANDVAHQLLRVDALGQRDPVEETSRRPRIVGLVREVGRQPAQHGVPLLPVVGRHVGDVLVDVVSVHVSVDGRVGHPGRLQVTGQPDLQDGLQDGAVRDQPTGPQRRHQDLREARQKDHPTLGVKTLDSRQRGVFVTQVPVRGVLQNDKVVAVGQGHQLLALRHAHSDAGRVVVIRHGIQELDIRVAFQRGLQGVQVQAVRLQRHRVIVRLVQVEGRQRPDVGRHLNGDVVAGVQQRLGHQLDALLPTDRQDDVVGRGGHLPPLRDAGHQLLPQRLVPLRGLVLKEVRALRLDGGVEGRLDLLDREQLLVRAPRRKGHRRGIIVLGKQTG